MPGGAVLVALGALGFAADPATLDAAWVRAEFVVAEPSPMPSPSANAVYRMINKFSGDTLQRLTPSVQDYFWSVLCNFKPACVDAWRVPSVATPSPSPEAKGWWHDAWATRESHHARDPESYADLWESPLTEADFSYGTFGRLRSNEYPYDYVYDYDNYDYDYSTKLYYWNGDETP